VATISSNPRDQCRARTLAPTCNRFFIARQKTVAVDHLIAELKAADTIIIGAPMYNFGISSTLKSWFDYVVRAGITFRYAEGGPVGLLEGKRAIVIESRGGFFSNGPTKGMDAQEPHLRTLLEFIGIKDVTFVRAEKLAFGPDIRQQSIAAARAQLHQAVHEYQRAI